MTEVWVQVEKGRVGKKSLPRRGTRKHKQERKTKSLKEQLKSLGFILCRANLKNGKTKGPLFRGQGEMNESQLLLRLHYYIIMQ